MNLGCFLHRMKHEIHDLNQMVSSFYQYLVPKKRTCVRYEAFVVRNILKEKSRSFRK